MFTQSVNILEFRLPVKRRLAFRWGLSVKRTGLFGAWGAGTAPGENPEPVLGFKKLGAPLEHRRESLFGPEDRGHIRASAAGH